MTAAQRRATLVLVLVTAVVLAAMAITHWMAARLSPATTPTGAALTDAALTGILFAILLIAGLLGRRKLNLTLLPVRPPVSDAAIGLAIGIGGFFAALALAALAGTPTRASGTADVSLLLLGTMVVAVQAAGEELLFRGWLLPALERGWGAMPALLVSAAAFALLHLAGGARAPLTLLNLFGGGLLFGLLAQRSGGLAAPIAAHFAWNWLEQIAFGLDPNPGVGSFGAICAYDLVGSAWWGGSGDGLNASLAMTASLTALLLPLAARPPAPASPPLSRSGARG